MTISHGNLAAPGLRLKHKNPTKPQQEPKGNSRRCTLSLSTLSAGKLRRNGVRLKKKNQIETNKQKMC